MNPRRIHEIMRVRFPTFNASELEWTNIAGADGSDLSLLASMLAEHLPPSEVLVEVHRKQAACLLRSEAASYVASHLGKSIIRIADCEFKSVVVIAPNCVAAGGKLTPNPSIDQSA